MHYDSEAHKNGHSSCGVVEYDGAVWSIDSMNDEYARLYPAGRNSRPPIVVDRDEIDGDSGEQLVTDGGETATCPDCGSSSEWRVDCLGDDGVQMQCDDCMTDDDGEDDDGEEHGLMTDGGRDVPLCSCGADLLETAELNVAMYPVAGAREPCPRMTEGPAATCTECGAYVGAMYGIETVVALWDSRGEPVPGVDYDDGNTDADDERLVTDGGRVGDAVKIAENADYVQYDGEGHLVYGAVTRETLKIGKVGSRPIKVTAAECTPSDVYGKPPGDDDDVETEQMRIDDFGGRRLMTDGGRDIETSEGVEDESETIELVREYVEALTGIEHTVRRGKPFAPGALIIESPVTEVEVERAPAEYDAEITFPRLSSTITKVPGKMPRKGPRSIEEMREAIEENGREDLKPPSQFDDDGVPDVGAVDIESLENAAAENDKEHDDSTPTTGTPAEWRENVPEEMQGIDRWLMWSGEPDTPRRPHWRGDYSVSYNDPDDWHTFDEAVEAAAEHESWGIGFVTADDVAVIDLDGVESDDGGPVDWAPGLGRLRRAYNDDGGPYVEWSPSDTGFHIPVSGMDKPDWWTNLTVAGRDHEGVDLLQGQFVTVTGQTERSFDGKVIDQCEAVGFLFDEAKENIEALNGGSDLDDTGAGGWTPDNEWLSEDEIREALTHIDADCGYPKWRNIGFAVTEYFHRGGDDIGGEARERAKELFVEWSETADEKWDATAEQQAERIIDDSWNSDSVKV